MKRKLSLLLLAALALVFSACNNDVVFQAGKDFENADWNKDSMVVFNYMATDTTGIYDIIVDVRNQDDYPYQNFWLFVNSFSPDGRVYRDTLDCILADNYGRWIGRGAGSLHQLPVSYMQRIQFPIKGNYRFELVQGMRDDTIHGISDIDISICHSPIEPAAK